MTRGGLLLVVPSRGRPQNIGRLWEALADTCTAATSMVVGLDEDDPCLRDYLNIPPLPGSRYVVQRGLRQVVSWVNVLAVKDARFHSAVGHIGDDNVPKTKGWDTAVLEALKVTPFAFTDDLYPREPGSLCCHLFARSEVVAKLGYLGPPSIRHMFVDPVWMAWGHACGITYLGEVIIEHLHRSNGKAPDDQTYRDAAACWDEDLAAFTAYCKDGLNADIMKLGGTPYTEAGLAEFKARLGIRD